MNTQIVSALIGAVSGGLIAAAGWFITARLSRQREQDARIHAASLRHLERQIEELYGPLVGLIHHSRDVYEVAWQRLPHSEPGKIAFDQFLTTEGADRIWQYFVETYFLPGNERIHNLLTSKLYLLDSGELPESFEAFLKYQAQFESLYRLWKQQGVDSKDIGRQKWPDQFGPDAEASLRKLRAEYTRHLQAAGIQNRGSGASKPGIR